MYGGSLFSHMMKISLKRESIVLQQLRNNDTSWLWSPF